MANTEGVTLAGLVRKYARRMNLADASIVRPAELFPKAKVITTDVADFRLYRRNRSDPITLIHP